MDNFKSKLDGFRIKTKPVFFDFHCQVAQVLNQNDDYLNATDIEDRQLSDSNDVTLLL